MHVHGQRQLWMALQSSPSLRQRCWVPYPDGLAIRCGLSSRRGILFHEAALLGQGQSPRRSSAVTHQQLLLQAAGETSATKVTLHCNIPSPSPAAPHPWLAGCRVLGLTGPFHHRVPRSGNPIPLCAWVGGGRVLHSCAVRGPDVCGHEEVPEKARMAPALAWAEGRKNSLTVTPPVSF